MTTMAHQIATRAAGGTVSVLTIRDRADGTEQHAVAYDSFGERWLSSLRYDDESTADAAAAVLGEFIGAEVRR